MAVSWAEYAAPTVPPGTVVVEIVTRAWIVPRELWVSALGGLMLSITLTV